MVGSGAWACAACRMVAQSTTEAACSPASCFEQGCSRAQGATCGRGRGTCLLWALLGNPRGRLCSSMLLHMVLGVWWDGGQCAGGEVLHPGGSGNPLSHCLAAPPAAEVTMWVHEEKLGDRNLNDVRGVGATRGCGGDGGVCGAPGLLLYGISVSCWILLAAVAGAGSLAHLSLLLGIN